MKRAGEGLRSWSLYSILPRSFSGARRGRRRGEGEKYLGETDKEMFPVEGPPDFEGERERGLDIKESHGDGTRGLSDSCSPNMKLWVSLSVREAVLCRGSGKGPMNVGFKYGSRYVGR